LQSYWLSRPLEVLDRGIEILSVLLPFTAKLVFWECIVRFEGGV
jgi:hypothetical protein